MGNRNDKEKGDLDKKILDELTEINKKFKDLIQSSKGAIEKPLDYVAGQVFEIEGVREHFDKQNEKDREKQLKKWRGETNKEDLGTLERLGQDVLSIYMG